jgi:signal transduction histidine kinase
MLQTTEKEKVELIINTINPTMALNISFGQDKEVDKLLQTILKEKNIKAVELYSDTINKKITKQDKVSSEVLSCKTSIKDPFSPSSIARMEIFYSNETFLLLYSKIIKIILLISILALVVFLSFYLFIKRELNALSYISDTLELYSNKQKVLPLVSKGNTPEINTITTVANEMMSKISSYVQELKSFNTKLEAQVQEKVQEIQLQEQMLIHQSRQAAMGEMLESIAHQWRQPLNIIGLSSANLETEYDLGIMTSKNFKDKMQIISDNINYMSNTIDDFRNFLNPDRELSYFNPENTIKDVIHILGAQLDNNKIKLTLQIENAINLYGIENEFKQVIFVLINNAKDAIKSREEIEVGEINIKIFSENEKNIIHFCDNGGGIKESIINSIFDPYFSTKFSSSGTGIGLYIAKNIVESRMHGHLSVQNIKNGCCFRVEQNIEVMS